LEGYLAPQALESNPVLAHIVTMNNRHALASCQNAGTRNI